MIKYSDQITKKALDIDDELTLLILMKELAKLQEKSSVETIQIQYMIEKLGLETRTPYPRSLLRRRKLHRKLWLKVLSENAATLIGMVGVLIGLSSLWPLEKKINLLDYQMALVLFSAIIAFGFSSYRYKKSSDDADEWFSINSEIEENIIESRK